MAGIGVSPALILAASVQLDLVAERLEAALAASQVAVNIIPSGAEEVSIQSAFHFNRGAGTHTVTTQKGIEQLHLAAQLLREHLAEYVAQDALHAAMLNVIPT